MVIVGLCATFGARFAGSKNGFGKRKRHDFSARPGDKSRRTVRKPVTGSEVGDAYLFLEAPFWAGRRATSCNKSTKISRGSAPVWSFVEEAWRQLALFVVDEAMKVERSPEVSGGGGYAEFAGQRKIPRELNLR